MTLGMTTPGIITLNKSTLVIITHYDGLIGILRITVSVSTMSLSIATVSLTSLSVTIPSIMLLSKTVLSMMA
jgi:hypothetical protein